ncbi:thiamine pyrophosphate-binding protein [Acrocarpospora catenulata]|uniref:thiamine pyrophosphate-binding protein n=1 Tax=Acrocarpospora catenulata TaxID=2836182 RepID=UPI0027E17A99|nr:thiamine pyrophosphate-binding protein [Acrocarpospora catenulata]
MTATGASVLVEALARHGVDLVFGIPGTHNVPIYQELAARGVRLITPRHEQGAGYAADGYARSTGRPGVVLTTTGPGAVNAATALAQAYSNSIPMLLISPGLPTDHPRQGRGYLHESKDQSAALHALCAWSHRVGSTREIPAAVARAFGSFAEGRPRPVHIEIPYDLLDAPAEVRVMEPYRIVSRPADPGALDAAARLLAGARRPGFVLGGGVQRPPGQPVGALAVTLAERLGARIVTTVNGKGAVPESHPLVLGAMLHLAGARDWLAGCDVVLAVGTELGSAELWVDDFALGGRLIRVDVDPGQMYGDHVADVPVVADAELALRGLLDRVTPRAAPPAPAPDLAGELRDLTRRWEGTLEALGRALPPDAVVVGDNSMVVYHGALLGLPFDPPARFLFPSGFGTLGYALPAAIGAKLAAPGSPTVVLTGDGALQFCLQDLATAVELELTLPIVVSDNGGFGEIRDEMSRRPMAPVAVELPGPDLLALAAAYGAGGCRADTPEELFKALVAALNSPLPTLIVVAER